MKKVLPIIICLCMSCHVLCQPNFIVPSNDDYGFRGILVEDFEPVPADSIDVELTRVYYDYAYNGKNTITGTWLLQVGVNTTCFLSEHRFKADSVLRANNMVNARVYNFISNGDLFHFFDAYYISNNKCRFTCRFGLDDIMYEEDLQGISWELQDSVANICGHLCKSATGYFRGRTYYVFYAEDIPVSAGPWKLSGLPGLILHADVDDGKFTFHANRVDPSACAPILWQKYPYMKTNRRQYEKMLDQMLHNFPVAIDSHLASNPSIVRRNDPTIVYPDLNWVEQLETE